MAEEVVYEPGGATAFVGRATVLLVGADADAAEGIAEALWPAVRDANGLQDVVDAVAGLGLRRLPSFGIVHRDAEGTHLLVRGAVRAGVRHAGGKHEVVTADGAVTWVERTVDARAVVDLEYGGAAAGGVRPLLGGVVSAGRVRVGEAAPPPAGKAAAPPPAGKAAAPAPTGEDVQRTLMYPGDRPVTIAAVTTDPGGEDGTAAPGAEASPTVAAPPASAAAESDATAAAERPAATAGAAEQPAAIAGTGEPALSGGDEFDDLFGATTNRPLEVAAIRPMESAEEEPPPKPKPHQVPEGEAPSALPGEAGAPEPPVRAGPGSQRFFAVGARSQVGATPSSPAASAGPLIEGVPGMHGVVPPPPAAGGAAGAPGAAAPPGTPVSGAGAQSVQHTISRSQLVKLKEPAAPPPSGARAPAVHGVWCPARHPNPPQATACRICQFPLDAVDPVTMPRPVLGRLRFSNGTEVELDRPVMIGRSPRAERVSGKEIPQLVTVPSPDQDISRNHVEIRLDGWHVLVVDLDSTNGTVVTTPGEAPQRLRSGEEMPITPGTVVSIADEITFVYEVTG